MMICFSITGLFGNEKNVTVLIKGHTHPWSFLVTLLNFMQLQ